MNHIVQSRTAIIVFLVPEMYICRVFLPKRKNFSLRIFQDFNQCLKSNMWWGKFYLYSACQNNKYNTSSSDDVSTYIWYFWNTFLIYFLLFKSLFLKENCKFWELLLVCVLAFSFFHRVSPHCFHRIFILRFVFLPKRKNFSLRIFQDFNQCLKSNMKS
jgi:hypothetical protein